VRKGLAVVRAALATAGVDPSTDIVPAEEHWSGEVPIYESAGAPHAVYKGDPPNPLGLVPLSSPRRPRPGKRRRAAVPDWILLAGGSPKGIEARMRDVVAVPLCDPEEGQQVSCRVSVSRLEEGRFAVRSEPTLPPYYWVSLLAHLKWLRGRPRVDVAVCWLTSPHSGLRYFLFPLPEGAEWETLFGVADTGERVSVDVLAGRMCRTSSPVRAYAEPPLHGRAEEVHSFNVVVDLHPTHGNPGFVVTDPDDQDWNKA
jgi:hypothetical protein